jgi:hypothetical protein
MAGPGKKTWKRLVPLTSCVPAVRLQKVSLALHKSFTLVSATLSHLHNSNMTGYQASSEYISDISHAASSSTQKSACSVEPGTVEDVSKIVR